MPKGGKIPHTCPFCGESWMGIKKEPVECVFCKAMLNKPIRTKYKRPIWFKIMEERRKNDTNIS